MCTRRQIYVNSKAYLLCWYLLYIGYLCFLMIRSTWEYLDLFFIHVCKYCTKQIWNKCMLSWFLNQNPWFKIKNNLIVNEVVVISRLKILQFFSLLSIKIRVLWSYVILKFRLSEFDRSNHYNHPDYPEWFDVCLIYAS